MKTTKAKGFTLIELIVVIAIIGVLAAILVPTMLGYVTKSRCSSANANAKSFYNAINSALVDLDSEGVDTSGLDGDVGATTLATSISDTDLATKVGNYFSDYTKLNGFAYSIDGGACTAVVVQNGAYYGSYPNPTVVDTPASGATGVSTQCKTQPTLTQAGA
ncbi:type II secretion system protein [uncultured Ruminococcus sp.]|uniref:type II secretion system protein n=2 Tax=Ruminococcus TaxID=1263 RepID=UPI0025F9F555|nr:type II secretion system protein [uncultured Ruminococcus sp.]